MRAVLVDWLVDVALYFSLEDDVLHAAVGVMDRFLSAPARRGPMPKARFQLLGITALLLATGSPPQSLSPYHHRLTPDTDVHHPTKYSQRRRLEALTPANTNPIRLALDFASLDEATAPPYSACFKVGAWFRRGLPDGGAEPPADGKETCDRGPNEWNSYDCWGKCIAEDLVSAEGRQMIIDVVTSAAAEISGFFAVEPVDGNLVFAESTSRYSRALILKGYDTTPACAFDCTALNGVAVASSYCDTGVAADVVLSVTKPPTIQGVGGTGGSCAADQRGRPTWLVFSWIQSVAKEGSVGSTVEQSLAMYRNLIVHELIHALGFSSHSFSNARDGAGARKGLISLMPVTDCVAELRTARRRRQLQELCVGTNAWLSLLATQLVDCLLQLERCGALPPDPKLAKEGA